MNLNFAGFLFGPDNISQEIGETKVGALWAETRAALRLLPFAAPRSIRIRRSFPGLLIFYGYAGTVWEALPPKTEPGIDFQHGTMKKFTWMNGIGVLVELGPEYAHKNTKSWDWEIE